MPLSRSNTVSCFMCGGIFDRGVQSVYPVRNPRDREWSDETLGPALTEDWTCQACTIRYTSRCSACATFILNAPALQSSVPGYCQGCVDSYGLCEDCDAPLINGSVRVEYEDGEDYGNYEVCRPCRSNFLYCDSCDCYHPVEQGICDRLDRLPGHASEVGYRFISAKGKEKTRRQVQTEQDRALYIGMELEMEPGNSRAKQNAAQKLLSESPVPGICKYDGSLSSYGIEFATEPHTLDAWIEKREAFGELLAALRKKGTRSYNTETCGLHLHVSRSAIGSGPHLYKLLALVYHNPHFILRLSGRGSFEHMQNYCNIQDVHVTQLTQKARRFNYPSRYSAVNICHNTVEFRFFKGTMAEAGIYRALQFADALVEWTRGVPVSEAGNLKTFKAWVVSHKKRYPDFAAWCANGPQQDDRVGETSKTA